MLRFFETNSLREGLPAKKRLALNMTTLRDRIGVLITAVLFLICLLVIFVINANQSSQQQLMWTVDFIQSLIQDLLVNPLFYLVFQYYAFKFHDGQFCTQKPRLQKVVYKILDNQLIELRVLYFNLTLSLIFKNRLQMVQYILRKKLFLIIQRK